jgi:hypothetical protein
MYPSACQFFSWGAEPLVCVGQGFLCVVAHYLVVPDDQQSAYEPAASHQSCFNCLNLCFICQGATALTGFTSSIGAPWLLLTNRLQVSNEVVSVSHLHSLGRCVSMLSPLIQYLAAAARPDSLCSTQPQCFGDLSWSLSVSHITILPYSPLPLGRGLSPVKF